MGVGSPPPDFLVAFGIDREYVSKHSYTWTDTADPANERYPDALEDALEDLAEDSPEDLAEDSPEDPTERHIRDI